MKTRWQEFRNQYWLNRSAQERRIISWASYVLFPLILYFLLWLPAHRGVSQLQNVLPGLQAQSIKLQAQASEIESLRHRPVLAALDPQLLKASIEDSATRNNIKPAISSLEIQPPNAVRISCEAIAFARWLAWLRNLEQEQHIRADSLSVTALGQPGMVRINATLSNGISQQ